MKNTLFGSTFAPMTLAFVLGACSGSHADGPGGSAGPAVIGASDFVSAPPGGRSASSNAAFGPTASLGNGGAAGSAAAGTSDTGSTGAPRTVEETDLYRVEGNRLYFLNAYRGLMVFDVTDVDHPQLLGRAPIFGSPVEMVVRNGVAVVVVGDWYGTAATGEPFHGSVVRGFDATDPANIKVTGEAQLVGWVRDTRVVGDVLYAVGDDYGWSYGYEGISYGGYAVGSSTAGPKVVVSSVGFAGGAVKLVSSHEFTGSNGIFNVTPNAIMLAQQHADPAPPAGTGGDVTGGTGGDVTGGTGGDATGGAGGDAGGSVYTYTPPPAKTDLQYIDISDPAGAIKLRGQITVDGALQGWSADNGRWNLDFADGRYAHTVGCGLGYCGGSPSDSYVVKTVDFADPDAPVLASTLTIPSTGWSVTARFDAVPVAGTDPVQTKTRLYLSPNSSYWYGGQQPSATPVRIYDLSSPTAPVFAGSTDINGNVWLFMPSGNQLFALGSQDVATGANYYGSQVSLSYLDVTNAAAPSLIGTSTFGKGWAWTPASGTFKAFTRDPSKGLVVLPFSGWDDQTQQYNNGLQLIEFTPASIATAGAAHTKGWVERGIFVSNRLVSLSDLSLAVIDYADHANPKVVTELTLARNVTSADPAPGQVAELSSDWWDNDLSSAELRVLPIANADETTSAPPVAEAKIDGTNARVFHNGGLSYVVSSVRKPVDCASTGAAGASPGGPTGVSSCFAWTQQVQVLEVKQGSIAVRGKVELPLPPDYGCSWGGWYGCYAYDWYYGDDVVQVGGDALAFRRWSYYYYDPNVGYDSTRGDLFVVDLSDPDAPKVASTSVTRDTQAWWGDMMAVGNTLYTMHYDWIERPSNDATGTTYTVKYFLDRIDLTDRSHPIVGARINVPGMLVGASSADPSVLYTVNYYWDGSDTRDELDVVKLEGDRAYLQGKLLLDGYVGRVLVRGTKAYLTAQTYPQTTTGTGGAAGAYTYTAPVLRLHEVDLSNPAAPVDRASSPAKGWGWLLDVQGDRALVQSGWGTDGLDIYRIVANGPPVYDQFVRVRGWSPASVSRQGNDLFLASGYWGVQVVHLPD